MILHARSFSPASTPALSATIFQRRQDGYTKLYADRYARDGIRMNNILPGFVENWPLSEDVRRTIPLGRATRMSELVGTVAFLLSPDSAATTGQNLRVDGGVNRGL